MRHSRSRLFLLSLIWFLLSSLLVYGQGGIGYFNSINVNDSLWNYGIHRQNYGGTSDAFIINHTGSGGNVFNFQVSGASIFLSDRSGNGNFLGPLTTYMIGIKDIDRSHALVHKWNENDAADRIINWLVNGANRTVSLSDDLTISALTNTRLLATDGSGDIGSTDLNSWVTGTANRVSIADDGDGTITVSGPQDIDSGATPTFNGLELTSPVLWTGANRPTRYFYGFQEAVHSDDSEEVTIVEINDSANNVGFVQVSSGSAAKFGRFIIPVRVPDNFSAWLGAASIEGETMTTDFANLTEFTILIKNKAGTVYKAATSVKPTGDGAWEAYSFEPTAAPTPGEMIFLVITIENADANDISYLSLDIKISYLASN